MTYRQPPFVCLFDHHGRTGYDKHTVPEILEHILHNQSIASRKENRMTADLTGIAGELDTLDADEQANAAAAAAILAILGTLQAGTISQDQIDALTAHATAIASGLEATTASEVAAEPTA